MMSPIRWACLTATAALCFYIGYLVVGVWVDHAIASITIGGTR